VSENSFNPDVLSCIANLSSDEVFTPPQLVNRILDVLPPDLWGDKKSTFLDPGCKSGVFLREIVKRLDTGLEKYIANRQKRLDHIFTNQVFGLAITELTALISRRSLYCSKTANGKYSVCGAFNNPQGNIHFNRVEHTWENGRCRYCGANEESYERGGELESHAYPFIHTDKAEEIFNMKFDVIIGNPPYQLGSSGGDSTGSFAMPIYQKFVQTAKRLGPRYVVMVTPSRWFAGGRGLDEYRSEMLSDTHLRELVDFPDATDVFPGLDISGGVSYFLWDRSHDGPCNVQTFIGGVSSGVVARRLNAYNVFVRYNTGVSILEKVWPKGVDVGKSLAVKVSPTQPFGLRTSYRGAPTPKGLKKPVVLRSSEGESWIARADVPRNDAWIDEWKVILGLAYGERGAFPYWITSSPEILGPGTACTETYLVIDRFDSKAKAKVFANYLRTQFVRFLISLQKYTQHLYSERFSFVPDLPMNQTWTDEKLYKKYGLTKDEVAFVESMVRPMDASDE
jgi:site-specific DNA-methyltransferase (adenine-specific)